MPILVTCECGKQFQTKDENVGRRARCPDCGRELIIPKQGSGLQDAPPFLEEIEPRTSGKAIASLILGVMSFLCFIVTGVPAIILGIMGMSEIDRSQGRIRGRGMALTGVIFGGMASAMVPIVAVLIALLLPAVQAAREAARRAQCVNNLKQMGLAFHNYHQEHNQFPAAAITDDQGKPLLSWRVAILPLLEQESLYKEFKLDEPWDSPHNQALLSRMPAVFACPSNPQTQTNPNQGMTPYQVIVGPGTLFEGEKGISIREITDGTSNTLLVVETKTPVPWTKPEDVPVNAVPGALGSFHPGGFNALFADGSVRFLKNSINPAVLRALITRDQGEVVSPDAQ